MSDDPIMARHRGKPDRRTVLFISMLDFTKDGAAQKRFRFLAEAMTPSGHDVIVVNPQWSFPNPGHATVATLPAGLQFLQWRIAASLWLLPAILLAARRSSVIVCFDRTWISMCAAMIAHRLTRLPLLHEATEHPAVIVPTHWGGKFSLFIWQKMVRSLDGAAVISLALSNLFAKLNPLADLIILPAISEIPPLPEARPEPGGKTLFLYSGSLIEAKDGVLSLVRAFHLARQRNPDMRLRIVGYGSEAQRSTLAALVAELGIPEQVEISAAIPQEEVPAILAGADVLVLCRPLSRQAAYGFPTKLAEYLASARPVITTITSDIGHYLRDKETAYLVPPNDIQAFADAMVSAASDPVGRETIGKNGWQIAERCFNAEICGARFAEWVGGFASRRAR